MLFLQKRKSVWNYFRTLSLVFGVLLLLTSCEKDDEKVWSGQVDGAFVVNEGSWGNSNGTVSFIGSDNQVYRDLFKAKNKGVLGDVLMDLDVVGDNIFMVLNGSNKIQVVNKEDFKWVATIEGFNNPRYAEAYNGKLYVTQWGQSGSVVVVDLESLEIEATINAGVGPEGIIAHDGYLWVANSSVYVNDNTISVIDPANNTVIKTIVVGDSPQQFVVDANGSIWVLCFGYIRYSSEKPYPIEEETASQLVQINSQAKEVVKTITIHANEHPANIAISPNGQTLYVGGGYTYNGIYAMNINANSYPTSKMIDGYFYGLSVNPANGDIYGCQAPTFTDPGIVNVYDASTGALKKSYKQGLGIGPRKVVF